VVLAVALSEGSDQGNGEGGGEGVMGVCPHDRRGCLTFFFDIRSREEHFTKMVIQSYVLDTLIVHCLRQADTQTISNSNPCYSNSHGG
jgi:hypothetical protein